MCLLSDDTIIVREKKKRKKREGVMLVLAVESPAMSIWLMRRLFFFISPSPHSPEKMGGYPHHCSPVLPCGKELAMDLAWWHYSLVRSRLSQTAADRR